MLRRIRLNLRVILRLTNFLFSLFRKKMDYYTNLFWISSLVFICLSVYLLCCTKRTPIFYLQIASGCGMFITSKIGRKFIGLE